jgi:DNA-binding SARP family transcriptional activator
LIAGDSVDGVRHRSAIGAQSFRKRVSAPTARVYACAAMVRIRVLGALALEVNGAAASPPAGRPAQALLGWLAVHPGIHARSEVAGRLWPNVLESSARASLRNALSSVRRALGPTAGRALVAGRETVGLAGEPEAWVDARVFDALIAAGEHEQALALWGGDLLAGLDSDWVLAARDAYRERLSRALAALADASASAGDLEQAIRYSRERVALDPFDEPAHRDLILCLAVSDRAGAIALYERLAERLRRQLGVAVSPQTRALADRVRRGQLDHPVAPAETPASASRERTAAPRLPHALLTRPLTTRFVGRAGALARLQALWAEVVVGEQRLAVVSGEPGIGKTRLLAEFAATVQATGARVLYSRAEEDALVPYQPFADALRGALEWGVALPDPEALAAVVPGLTHQPPRSATLSEEPPAGRLRLFDAVRGSVEAAATARPLLLALDDLHWADRPTLRLLAYLAKGRQPASSLLLGAYRQTEITQRAPLFELLADLRRDVAVEEITLDGLGSGDVAALLAQTMRQPPGELLVARVRAQTAGNPFYIEELFGHVHDPADAALAADPVEIPANIQQAVAHRAARLGSQASALLAAGAVLGPEFELELAAEIEGLPLDPALRALEHAVRAGLILEVPGAPGSFTFAHALVRDVLAGSLTAARRARLHALAATALEPRAQRDPERHLAALVQHALEGASLADDPLRAAELAQQAAARASSAYAYEQSAELLERALIVLRRTGADHAREAAMLCSLGEALQRSGNRDRASGILNQAVELAHRVDDPRLLARATLAIGGLGVTILEVDRALVARLQDALAALSDRDEELRARVLARLSVELTYDPDENLRDSISLQAVESARRSGAPAALASALGARHVALSHAEHTAARLQTATEMLDVARRAGDRELALQARNWRVADLFELGDGARVNAELDAYAALASDVRLPSYSWYVPLWRATLATLAGKIDEGHQLAARARDLGRRAGDANADVFFQTHRYMSWLADERYEEWVGEALEFTEEKIRRSPAGLAYLAGMATVFAATGRDDDARRAIEIVAADDFATVPRDMNWLSTIASAAEVCATLGDTRRARTVRSLLEPYADRMVISARAAYHQGSVNYFLARLAAAAGDHRAADELYSDAAARDERAGAAIWVVRDQWRHADLVLAARGGEDRAHQLLKRAYAGAKACGLERIHARIAAEATRPVG